MKSHLITAVVALVALLFSACHRTPNPDVPPTPTPDEKVLKLSLSAEPSVFSAQGGKGIFKAILTELDSKGNVLNERSLGNNEFSLHLVKGKRDQIEINEPEKQFVVHPIASGDEARFVVEATLASKEGVKSNQFEIVRKAREREKPNRKAYQQLPLLTFGVAPEAVLDFEEKEGAVLESNVQEGDTRTITYSSYAHVDLVRRLYFFKNEQLVEVVQLTRPLGDVLSYDKEGRIALMPSFRDWAKELGFTTEFHRGTNILLQDDTHSRRLVVLPATLEFGGEVFAELHYLHWEEKSIADPTKERLSHLPKLLVPLGTPKKEVVEKEKGASSKLLVEDEAAGYLKLEFKTKEEEKLLLYRTYLLKTKEDELRIAALWIDNTEGIWKGKKRLADYFIKLFEDAGYFYRERVDQDGFYMHFFYKEVTTAADPSPIYEECKVDIEKRDGHDYTTMSFRKVDYIAP